MTFAALFSLGILGVSVIAELRHGLARLGAPWYVWLPVPMVLVAVLARKETQWMPEPDQRRKLARRLMLGSLALALGLAWLTPARKPAATPAPAPQRTYIRPHK